MTPSAIRFRARWATLACWLGGATAVSAAVPTLLKEAFQEHFLVGAAINRSHATGHATGRRTAEQVEAEIALIKAQFNQITAENDMKWERIHPRPGKEGYDFGPADAFVEFGEKHRQYLVGHTLVWHHQTPDWVFAGTIPPPATAAPSGKRQPGQMRPAYAGPRASRDELLGRMRDHIRTVVGRYKGKIRVWDVVNEALADGGPEKLLRDSLWLQIIGPDYLAKAFQYAHEADPGAILRYNDYGLEDPVKARKLVALISSLREQGVPIHAIGTQAHLNVSTATLERLDRSLTELARLGLPIHVTELDINGAQGGQRSTGAELTANAAATQGGLVAGADNRLTRAYEEVFRAFLQHRDVVKLVTFWGVNDAVSWRRDGHPLLFDSHNRPKPAVAAVLRLAAASPGPPRVVHDLTARHDATRVLVNPHKGWYHHFPDNHPDKYRIARDADLLEFPGMDHLYIRLAWSYLEPREGQFDWAVIDRLITKWTAHGLGIAFRISCKETSTDRPEQQYATPRWVLEAGARGGHYRAGQPAGPEAPWEPVWDDPVFLEKLERFLAAFAARYDGQPWLRYLDIGSIGDWGEGHCWAGSRQELSFAVRKRHVDLHLQHFRRTPLVISDDYVHALKDPAERSALHQEILARGISYRDDSIMVNGYFAGTSDRCTVRSPEFFAEAHRHTPTVLELEHYGKVKQLGNWEARTGSEAAKFGRGKTGPDFFRGALELLHATYLGYHGDAREWLTDNPALTRELLNRCGYWLFPLSLALPPTLVAGTVAPLRVTIDNRGVAPPYHPYELRVKLAAEAASWVGGVGRASRSWLPGAPIVVEHPLALPADLRPGRYTVSLGLFDVSPGRERTVELALRADLRDSAGFYRVAEFEVGPAPGAKQEKPGSNRR
jgi:GH35 family endo-1,4-beta-xylanase